MTRRKFIRGVMEMLSGIVAGARFLAGNVTPHKFVRALKPGKFPGLIKPLQKIKNQGKWSG